MKDLKTFLIAAGIGAATALALIPASGLINWRLVGVEAGKAVLAALGVTALVRKT